MHKFLLSILFVFSFSCLSVMAQEEQVYPVRGRVTEVLQDGGNEISEGYYAGSQFVKVRIAEGEDKGKTVVAEHSTNAYFSEYETFTLKKGDKVFVSYTKNADGTLESIYVTDVVREGYLFFLIGLFVLLVLMIGKGKGFKTILTLGITILVVIKGLIPLILRGFPPVITAVVLCSVIVMVCFTVISGWRLKTLAATIGTVTGIFVAGMLALAAGSLAHLTGLAQEETLMMINIPQSIQFNFQGLLFAGIIIGAMGAVMDVGMSISSALNEIKENSPGTNFRQLIRSGMNVGRDIMGTMSNTLILAYTGGALNLMLLFAAYEVPLAHIINGDYMASEIVRALAGSIGIVLTIPVTTLISAWLYTAKKNQREEEMHVKI